MSDVVVTVPADLWFDWLDEGDLAGQSSAESGQEWGFFGGGPMPHVLPGERVYIVAHRRLRGYAPLTRRVRTSTGWCLCRRGGAVACTVPFEIPGFRGWRNRWWHHDAETLFPDWRTANVVPKTKAHQMSMRRWLDGDRSGAVASGART